jgi:hypothetical protein
MADKARNRLVKQREDLKELREQFTHVHGRIFFKLLTCSPSQAFPLEVWEFLTGTVIESQEKTTPVPFEIRNERIDPFPCGSQCLWWWGDSQAVEKFCRWADETAVTLWEHRESLPDLAPAKGRYQTLATLCTVAQEAKIGDPRLVVNRVLLPTDGHPRLPPALARAAPPVTFRVLDVAEDGVSFALDVLDHLLGNVPRLVVDVAGQNATWKGKTYPLREEQAAILDLLHKHLGKGPLAEAQMKAACPQLAGVHFNRTLRERLPAALRDLVKSKPGQGWWLELD